MPTLPTAMASSLKSGPARAPKRPSASRPSPKRRKMSENSDGSFRKDLEKGAVAGLGVKRSPDVRAPEKVLKKKRRFAAGEKDPDVEEAIPPKKPVVLDRKGRKELTEIRKKKRKPHYDLEKEVVALWEKSRQRNIPKEDRAKLVSDILNQMKGKLSAMAVNHVTTRVLQTCLKYCGQDERDAVFDELRPHCLMLAMHKYAYHLVTKMMDHVVWCMEPANKAQLQQMLGILHGNVVALLRHPSGSPVVEHAYTLSNGMQKQELLSEFYSPEFRLFKGMVTSGQGRLRDLLAAESASKRRAVLEHMTLSLQPILEKGIVDHSIIHRALVEYLSVSKTSMIQEVVQQLSGALLVRMLHTRDGGKIGVTCVMHGSNKERKKLVKGMKGHVAKIACDEFGSVVLLSILDVIDDTKLVTKIIIKEVMKELKELALHKINEQIFYKNPWLSRIVTTSWSTNVALLIGLCEYGRRVLLHLLAPQVTRYFPPVVLSALETPVLANTNREEEGSGHGLENNGDEVKGVGAARISKKDSSLRRTELLRNSGLAKELADICTEHAKELLESPWGKDLIYEVAMGGPNGEIWQAAPSGVTSVHKAIADLAALPSGSNESGVESEEHVLEHYHASRTIRRLILDAKPPPTGIEGESFSSILWSEALKGKCKGWSQGHSAKVVSALRDSADPITKKAAVAELQVLIDSGVLQVERKV